MGDHIRELLSSPLTPEPRRFRGHLPLVTSVLLVSVVGLGLWASRHQGPAEAVSPVPTTVASTTSTPAAELVAFEPDPPLIYYPRILPSGWTVCATQLHQPTIADELCSPGDDLAWVKVALASSGSPRGTAVEGHPGLVVVRSYPPEVGIVVGETGYRLWSPRLTLDELTVIAASIPIASPALFEAREEPPITLLQESDLAAMLGTPQYIDFRDYGDGNWVVTGGGLILATFQDTECSTQLEAVGLGRPQLVSEDHQMVIGATTSDFSRGSRAYWCQRNRSWSLTSEWDSNRLAEWVSVMEDTIARLP